MPAPISELERINRIKKAISGKAEFMCWDGGFSGIKSRAKYRCLIDGHEWSSPIRSLENGSGCPRCAASFRGASLRACEGDQIGKLAPIAANRYTFERVGDYVGNTTRYLCTCLADGHQWDASLANLLRRKGCPKCIPNAKKTQAEYEGLIAASLSGSGVKFLGFDGVFKGNSSIGLFVCPRGTEYAQIISSTLNGCRCRCCISYTEQDIIDRFNSAKGVRFIEWDNGFSGIKTRAWVAGDCGHQWLADIGTVELGCRCPACADCGYNPGKPAALYVMQSECKTMVKVGISNKPDKRLAKLRRDTPFKFRRITMVRHDDGAKIAKLEKDIHAKMERVDFGGVRFDGYTEWMKADGELFVWLKEFSESGRLPA